MNELWYKLKRFIRREKVYKEKLIVDYPLKLSGRVHFDKGLKIMEGGSITGTYDMILGDCIELPESTGGGFDAITECDKDEQIKIGHNMIVIFDLDGTLALIQHRRHFVENGNSDWDSFHKACVDDNPNHPVIEIFKTLQNAGHYMFVWSGRSDAVRAETEEWLLTHGIFCDDLKMRTAGDHQPDVKLKKSWLDAIPPITKHEIMCVFDDRQRLVDMWREEGLTCLQVAPGDF